MEDRLFQAFVQLRIAGLSLEDVSWFFSSPETLVGFEQLFQKFFNPRG